MRSERSRYWAIKNLALWLLVGLPVWLLLRLMILVSFDGESAAQQWLAGIALLMIVLAPSMLMLGALQLLVLWALCRIFPAVPARALSLGSVAAIPLGYVLLNRGESGVLGSADFLIPLLAVLLLYALVEALPPAVHAGSEVVQQGGPHSPGSPPAQDAE